MIENLGFSLGEIEMTETKKQLLVRGMKDGIPIGLGYFAVSFTLGIAAKNAGMTAIAVEDDYSINQTEEKIKLADYYIKDFDEFMEKYCK